MDGRAIWLVASSVDGGEVSGVNGIFSSFEAADECAQGVSEVFGYSWVEKWRINRTDVELEGDPDSSIHSMYFNGVAVEDD